MNEARTGAQKVIVSIATQQFGQGKGVDNSVTGGLLAYIQELENRLKNATAEADENWRNAVAAREREELQWRWGS